MNKKRLFSYDLIRTVAVFSIVLCHFNARYSFVYYGSDLEEYMLLDQYPFGLFLGDLGVSLFFILSGASLYYNYYDCLDIKEFYKKRFFSIYPMFWIAYTALFILRAPKMLASGIPLRNIFFTVIGMDGYLAGIIPTFYLIGEWFLGAIILIYLIFPFIRWSYRKNCIITWVLTISLYLVFVFMDIIPWLGKSSIIFIRLPEILVGMTYTQYLMKKRDRQADSGVKTGSKTLIKGAATVILLLIPMIIGYINISSNSIKTTLIGSTFFVFLATLAEFVEQICRYDAVSKICMTVSIYSYAVYLVHHIIIDIVCDHIDMLSLTLQKRIGLFVILVIMIGICAFVLQTVTKGILRLIKRKNN